MFSSLVCFDALCKGNVFFVVGVGGESEFLGYVLACIHHLCVGTPFHDVERVVECPLVGIPCREKECVAPCTHHLIVSASCSEFVNHLVKFDAVTLGRAVADGVDGG